MNTRDVVILIGLGAALSFGGKTVAVKTGQGVAAVARAVKKPAKPVAKIVAKPIVFAVKRIAK